ncbi:tetratricopeptide repeat protein [Myxococcus fulvus]|uniref:tetratricopeptide repeat protein n=1 Tax=Myxococcus fulvus TaxID=33 RepID=UPI003B9CA03F
MLTPLLLLLTAAPPDAAALRAQAQKAYDAKQFAKACPLFEKLTRLSPQDGATWADLSLCLFRAKKKREALDAARHAVRWGDEKTRKNTYFNLDKFGGEDRALTRDGDAPCAKAHLPACGETAWLCPDPYSDLYRTSGSTSGGSYSAVFLCSTPQSPEAEGCSTIDLGQTQDTFAGDSDDSPGVYSFKGCAVVAVDPCERRLGLSCTEGEGVLAGEDGRTVTSKRDWVEERSYAPLPKPASPDAGP